MGIQNGGDHMGLTLTTLHILGDATAILPLL